VQSGGARCLTGPQYIGDIGISRATCLRRPADAHIVQLGGNGFDVGDRPGHETRCLEIVSRLCDISSWYTLYPCYIGLRYRTRVKVSRLTRLSRDN